VFLLTFTFVRVVSAQTPQNSPPSADQGIPNAPSESKKDETKKDDSKKDQNPGPAQQLGDTAKSTLLKARDWESSWIAGIYVGKNRKLVPLTRNERSPGPKIT
jgi:hypothetical protein